MKTMMERRTTFSGLGGFMMGICGVLALTALAMAGCAGDVSPENPGLHVLASTLETSAGLTVFDVAAISPQAAAETCVSENLQEDSNSRDGTMSSFYDYEVVCLTPTTYPSFLTSMSLVVDNFAGDSSTLVIFKSSAAGGPPGTSLIWESSSIQLPSQSLYTHDLTNVPVFDTPITSGSWCFGIHASTSDVFIWLDNATVSKGHFWIGSNDWRGYARNPFIRGTEESCGTCACYIAGACYADGAAKPDDAYQFCNPENTITGWTSRTCLPQDLIGDNGVKNGGVSGGNYDFVTCIQPSAYPSFLTGINALSVNANGTDQTNYVVYKTQDTDGPPLLPAVWKSAKMAVPHNTWQHVDLTGETAFDTPITSGSWCIGINTPSGTNIFAGQTYPGIGKGYWSIATDDYMSHDTSYDLSYRGETEICPACACYIDGFCYVEGAVKLDNLCMVCRAASSVNAWSFDDGKSCSDGLFCNGADDVCDAGVCTHPGNTCDVVCQNCNEDTNKCDDVAGQCDGDSNGCTPDTCQAGTCVVGPAIDCIGFGDQCNASVCVSTGNTSYECSPDPAPMNGLDCDDNNACTQTATCQAGGCVGSDEVVCQSQDACHTAGTCSVDIGICTNPVRSDWVSCAEEGSNVCIQGVCESLAQNDTCSTAIQLIAGEEQSANLNASHAFLDVPDTCVGTALSGADAFYTFSYEAGKDYTVTLTPDDTLDVALIVWEDCETTDTCLAGANAGAEGNEESLLFAGRESGGSIIVQVLSLTEPGSDTSGFKILIEEVIPVDGDNQETGDEAIEDVASPDDGPTDTAVADTAFADTATPDTVTADTAFADTASTDSASSDTVVTPDDGTAGNDSGPRQDTTVTDGGPDDAVPPENGNGCASGTTNSASGTMLALLMALVALIGRSRLVARISGNNKE